MKIAWVIGHRRGAQGAFGSAGKSEYAFWTEAVEEMFEKGYLSDVHTYGVFRRKDKYTGYTERMKELHRRIDAFGADVSISLHFNASSKPYVSGHEILYCSSRGRELAKRLDAKLDQYLDNRDRNIKRKRRKERGGGFLCRGRSVSILVEPFFASQQHLYVKGAEERENLLSALSAFVNELEA